MNWKLVALLAIPFGLAFATLTITGTLAEVGAIKWTIFGTLLGTAWIVVLQTSAHPLQHGLATGFLFGLVAVETQALFMNTYLLNNPQAADVELPLGWSARMATAVLGPLNAVLAALVTGGLAWGLWHARRILSEQRGKSR